MRRKRPQPPLPLQTPLPELPSTGVAVPPLTDAKVQDAGAESTLPPMPGSDQNPPLPSLVGQTESGTGMDAGKANEPALAATRGRCRRIQGVGCVWRHKQYAEALLKRCRIPHQHRARLQLQAQLWGPRRTHRQRAGRILGIRRSPPVRTSWGRATRPCRIRPLRPRCLPPPLPLQPILAAPAEPAASTTMPEPNAPTDECASSRSDSRRECSPAANDSRGKRARWIDARCECSARRSGSPDSTLGCDGSDSRPGRYTSPAATRTRDRSRPFGCRIGLEHRARGRSLCRRPGADSQSCSCPGRRRAPRRSGRPMRCPPSPKLPRAMMRWHSPAAPPEIKPGEGDSIPNAGKGLSLEDDLSAAIAPAASAVGAAMVASGAGGGGGNG